MKQMVLFFLAAFIVVAAWGQPSIKYVTQSGAGLKNGSSWANAWSDSIFGANLHLQTAGTEVWVAKGTYSPNYNHPTNNFFYPSTNTFLVPNGVKLYGGFAGNEASISDRASNLIHTTNETKLTGFVPIPSGAYLNQTRYVVKLFSCGLGETLDGLTISDASGAGVLVGMACTETAPPVINNCIIKNNRSYGANYSFAGGIQIESQGTRNITISNSFLINNTGAKSGAIVSTGATPNITNCVFSGNIGSEPNIFGASSCVYLSNGSSRITNCTFMGNTTNEFTALLATENVSDSILINNSILWGNDNFFSPNTPPTVNQFRVISGSNKFSVKNCVYQPPTPGLPTGTTAAVLLNTINASPFVVNESSPAGADGQWGTADDGLNLTACSPGVNMGNNAIVSGVAKDILGNNRIFGSQVDLGAYELQQSTATSFTVLTQPTNTAVTVGDTAQFSILVSGTGIGYQWQRFAYDTGWINLANSPSYSGVTTAQLSIYTAPGYSFALRYRCLINNPYCSGYQSNQVSLLVESIAPITLCPGGNSQLTATLWYPPPTISTAQWQVDTGSTGFHYITNGPQYSGTGTATLQLINIPSAWYGYKYRYVVNGNIYGRVYQLKFTNTWRGTANNSWENPANWSCGQVPDANTDVTIGITTIGSSTGPSHVMIGANSICRTLTVLPPNNNTTVLPGFGNAVTVLPGFTLTVVR